MCDTLGKNISGNIALFAKNSDRSPNEPQVNEYRPAAEHSQKKLCATYIEIDQVPHTHATLLSRPVWMWGAEMGVNEHGVCIGNEAVFTKGKYSQSGLTGMDLVRLGLERGATAKEALQVIIDLLKRHGQGGNCGYDHKFFYDNAFLIMDRQSVYILQTAGNDWVYKQVQSGSISNRLSIGNEGDCYSNGEPYDFAGKHLEPVYSHFSGSKNRLTQTASSIGNDVEGMISALRTHRNGTENHLTAADVKSPCMHAGGLVGDHTTASMVIELGEHITVWVTGSSTPCISLFKPWRFGTAPISPVFPAGQAENAKRDWLGREAFHRNFIGQTLPAGFYAEKSALEAEWIFATDGATSGQMEEISKQARRQETDFYHKWNNFELSAQQGNRSYLRYWQKKTERLKKPERPVTDGD